MAYTQQETKKLSKELKAFIDSDNIAEDLSKEKLDEISRLVTVGYDEDLNSCTEWFAEVKEVIELASLLKETKNTPLPNSSNVKYPLIVKACYEFSSRTYPEIVKEGKVVKARVIGLDHASPADPESKAAKASRATDYMNYQLLYESNDWEKELDHLLNTLALIGFVCKKVYYDPIKSKNVSQVCEYNDIIINSSVKNLKDARRVTHILHQHTNDLISSSRAGLYLKKEVEEIIKRHGEDDLDKAIDLLEQHRYLDLDDDGYEEPYIVTVDKDSGKVLRIVARYTEEDVILNAKDEVQCIYPIQYFIDYHFLVSPKGKFQSVGFGILLLHLNETINTVINQLVDAGQLNNMQGGFIDARAKIQGGNQGFDRGDWKKVKTMGGTLLKDSFLPLLYKEPSTVLYQLLVLMIDAGKDLASSTELLSGNQNTENSKSTAVLALIEQGMKMFTAIQKRIYRSLTDEFKQLFRLNHIYLDESVYQNVLDDIIRVSKEDFDMDTMDVVPVADPNLSSDVQRFAAQQALMGTMEFPEVNRREILTEFYLSLKLPNPQRFLVPQEELQKQPNPEVIKLQGELEHKAQQLNQEGERLEIEKKRLMLDAVKQQAEIGKLKADAILSIAKAEAAEAGSQYDQYMAHLNSLQNHVDNILAQKQLDIQDSKNIADLDLKRKEIENAKSAASPVGGTPNDPSAV